MLVFGMVRPLLHPKTAPGIDDLDWTVAQVFSTILWPIYMLVVMPGQIGELMNKD